MKKRGDNREESLFIRVQSSLSKRLHSKILSSVLTFYIPLLIIGYLLQISYDYKIFSRGVFISLLWLAIAPYLIFSSHNVITNFFNSYKHIFKNKKEWKFLYEKELDYTHLSKYLLLRLAFGIITSLIILFVLFKNAPLPIQIWCLFSFFLLFFISTIGFYGAYTIIHMIQDICNADLVFNPLHPDGFGGLSELGKFAIKGTVYISSGAMVFPLVMELSRTVADKFSILNILIYILAGGFVLTLLASFLMPMLDVKDFIGNKSEELILESNKKLNSMISKFKESKKLNLKESGEILMYYYFYHMKLFELKEYPYDLKVILEYFVSLIIPIIVAVLEFLP